jgi:hypothetical protein
MAKPMIPMSSTRVPSEYVEGPRFWKIDDCPVKPAVSEHANKTLLLGFPEFD